MGSGQFLEAKISYLLNKQSGKIVYMGEREQGCL